MIVRRAHQISGAGGDDPMSMKTILIPTESSDAMRSVLATALTLAQRFESYIEGFPLHWASGEAIAVDMMGGILIERGEREKAEATATARHLFESFMQQHGVPRATDTTGRLSFGWLNEASEGDSFAGNYGRVFDITVMGRAAPNSAALRARAIESALFESGRPVLLSPPSPPSRIGSNVLIPWNRSTEQALATALAMPLLQKADRVTVLSVTGGAEVPGPPADRLVRHLRRNSIPAEILVVAIEGRTTGEAVLAVAESLGCDLLIKGAYTQSRLRQMIFGGTTQHIMANANVPVLLAK